MGVGKCERVWEGARWVWEIVETRVRWVWGRGVGWVRGVWGEVSGECRDSPTFSHIFPNTSPHLHTYFSLLHHNFYTHPIHFSTPLPYFPTSPTPHLPHVPTHFPIPPPHFPTPSIIPQYLIQLLKLPKIAQFLHHPYSPKFSMLSRPRHSPPMLSHTPHIYFIINPIPKFLTLLIYCQI